MARPPITSPSAGFPPPDWNKPLIQPHMNLPGKISRIGETLMWTKFDVGNGEKRLGWLVAPKYSYNVFKVTWEIYSQEREDLLSMLWNGSLRWAFSTGVTVDIAPLSTYDGGFVEMLNTEIAKQNPGSKGIIEGVISAMEEGEWLRFCKEYLLNGGLMYRGMLIYRKHPVLLPEGDTAQIEVNFDNALELKHDVRMRVTLHGWYQSVIAVK